MELDSWHARRRRAVVRRSRRRVHQGLSRARRDWPLGVQGADRHDDRDVGDLAVVTAAAERHGDRRRWPGDVALSAVGGMDRAAPARSGRMNATTWHDSIAALFGELIDGPPSDGAYMLNGGDRGVLRSLDAIDAAAASRMPPAGGATIAAHVDHLAYGITLLNRWSGGEANPWADADWTASWQRTAVNEAEW